MPPDEPEMSPYPRERRVGRNIREDNYPPRQPETSYRNYPPNQPPSPPYQSPSPPEHPASPPPRRYSNRRSLSPLPPPASSSTESAVRTEEYHPRQDNDEDMDKATATTLAGVSSASPLSPQSSSRTPTPESERKAYVSPATSGASPSVPFQAKPNTPLAVPNNLASIMNT